MIAPPPYGWRLAVFLAEQGRAMPSARALVNRANLRCLGLSASVAIALAGCAKPESDTEQLLGLIKQQQGISERHTAMMAKVVIILGRQEDRIEALEKASGMSASGQDPKGLEAKPASPTREAGDAQ